MDIRYDQPFTGISGLTAAPAQKAGNISQIASRVRGREAQILSYSYDYLSRLSSSTFHNYSDAGVISGTNNYNENLTYDLRGNIQTLQRTGFYTNGSTCTYGQIDNLTYSYTANTNRLHKVLDGTLTAGDAKSRGFNGLLSTVDNSMTYDRNGNLNKNLHKNVSTITYNHLNLPTVITFTTGNSIEFLYDAAGTKLRKTVKVGATVQYIQDYLPGGIEYSQTGTGVKRVESVFHAEGRFYNTNVDVSSTLAWRKEYNMKDHLGNTRLVFTDRNANGIVEITGTASTSDVLQENHYYAFGLAFEGAWLQNDATARDNAYQYNGKELNSDFGLGWNDYGARWYDGSIARWNSVDPMAGNMRRWSPYNYAFDNPMRFIDPDGMKPFGDFYNQNGKKVATDGKEDGKVYVVADNKEAKNLEKAEGSVKDASEVKSAIELPNAYVRSEMGKAVERSNAKNTNRQDEFKGDDDEGGFHEEGGVYGKDINKNYQVINAKPGAKTEPDAGIMATVKPNDPANPKNAPMIVPEGSFHVHPRGTRSPGSNTLGGETRSFNQDPTNPIDFTEASNYRGYSYVLGAKGTVSIINGKGIVATFPLNKFINIGNEKK